MAPLGGRIRALLPSLLAALVATGSARGAQHSLELVGPGDDRRLERGRTLDDEHLVAPPATLEAWRARRDELRTRVRVAAGLWPAPVERDLAARVDGAIVREGYVVQHVALEVFPGFHVTGNLYRPDPPPAAPAPGVLCPHGHWTDGRFCERSEAEARAEIERGAERHLANARYHLQARCAGLARMGCVVFHYDMAGYADSVGIEHARGFSDAEALLELQSAFGLQTWSSIRALDFLASLPDVDAARIGVTGASGGGTQTFVLCAVDERPRVALPAVMVSCAMQGGCACENAPYLRIGTDNVELAALMAPRALCLTGANDWTIAIEEKGLPELRAIYALHGAAEAVHAECSPQFDHNYNVVARELCYRWFARWLDLAAPAEEAEIVPVPPAELSVWSASRPPRGPEPLESVRTRWRADVHAELDALERAASDDAGAARWRALVAPALAVVLGTELPPRGAVREERIASAATPAGERTELRLARAGARETVPATLLAPARWNGRVVVAVAAAGRASFLAPDARVPAERVTAKGALFLAIDPYGVGTWRDGRDAPLARTDPARHAEYAGYSYAYERPAVAERVHDVLTAIAWARALDGAREIVLVGLGDAASWVWLARTQAGDAVARTVLERDGDPWRVADASDPELLPGIGRYRGRHDLAPLVFPGEVVLAGRGALLEHAAEHYAARGRPDAIRVLDERDAADLARWIDAPLAPPR